MHNRVLHERQVSLVKGVCKHPDSVLPLRDFPELVNNGLHPVRAQHMKLCSFVILYRCLKVTIASKLKERNKVPDKFLCTLLTVRPTEQIQHLVIVELLFFGLFEFGVELGCFAVRVVQESLPLEF